MAIRFAPRLFGPYVLTRPLGSDPLGNVFRAGTLEGPKLAPFALIRTFDGEAAERGVLVPAMETAVEYLDEIRGQAVAKGAVLGIVDGVPFAGIDYVPGRTLDHLLGSQPPGSAPLQADQALLIAQKILISLEATHVLTRPTGAPHGFVVPAFVAVSFDGEVRVFGAGLGKGLLPSLRKPAARAAFASYLAPEVVASGVPSTAGDVYSTSAILYECLTGTPPTHGKGEGLLAGARLQAGNAPVPDDILALLARGLASDPARREGDVTAFRRSLDKVLFGGTYKTSTFSLAFLMNQRFSDVIEIERKQQAAEETLDVARLQASADVPEKPAVRRPPPPVPRFGAPGTSPGTQPASAPKTGLSPVAMLVASCAILVLAAAAGWLFLRSPSAPAPKPAAAVPTPAPSPTVPPPTPAPVMAGKDDPAFQAALEKQLQLEMKRVQDQIQKEQDAAARKRQAEQAKVAEEERKALAAEDALRVAKERADKEEVTRVARQALEARQRQEAARAAAAAAVPKTKDGDLLELTLLDQQPLPVRVVRPEPPALAKRLHVTGVVILRVLVNEKGRAETVEVLRDTSTKAGLGQVSAEAVRGWEWKPAMKDGKRVKTWITVPIPFKL